MQTSVDNLARYPEWSLELNKVRSFGTPRNNVLSRFLTRCVSENLLGWFYFSHRKIFFMHHSTNNTYTSYGVSTGQRNIPMDNLRSTMNRVLEKLILLGL